MKGVKSDVMCNRSKSMQCLIQVLLQLLHCLSVALKDIFKLISMDKDRVVIVGQQTRVAIYQVIVVKEGASVTEEARQQRGTKDRHIEKEREINR